MTHAASRLSSAPAFTLPFGSNVMPDGRVQFKLWAPTARQVELCIHERDKLLSLPLEPSPGGWYAAVTDKAQAGSLYQYRIDGDLLVPDPASRYQPQDVHGPSQVIDPSQFDWSTQTWSGRPWEEVICYELHVGTFSPEGTFHGVTSRLDYLKDLGVTAIELMPVADFPGGRNWGYDGVLLFAPDSSYGTPDDLRTLIRTAHEKGIMVFLDLVYNHFGPEGNYLHVYAKQFFNDKHKTPWGAAINFDGAGSDVVRQFFVANTLFWLSEYHFDGLRFDAIHAIKDQSQKQIMVEIAEAVKAGPGAARQIHLIAENDDNIADFLKRDRARPELFHAQWNDDIHHAMHVIATGEADGYYADYAASTSAKSAVQHLARCLTEGFAYQNDPSQFRQGERRGQSSKHLPPTAFVTFIQNHDQVGNRAMGERIGALTSEDALRALTAAWLLSPGIPMLFMGEEWQATTPFFYFCDLGPDLAPLVTEGRRSEFAKFPQFQDPAMRETIPDPVAPDTFERSKLNWSEAQQVQHRTWWQYYRDLIAIRKSRIQPLLEGLAKNPGTVLRQQGDLLFAEWDFGVKGTLYLIANLGDKEVHDQIKLPAGTKLIFESSGGAFAQLGYDRVHPWSVIWSLHHD